MTDNEPFTTECYQCGVRMERWFAWIARIPDMRGMFFNACQDCHERLLRRAKKNSLFWEYMEAQ